MKIYVRSIPLLGSILRMLTWQWKFHCNHGEHSNPTEYVSSLQIPCCFLPPFPFLRSSSEPRISESSLRDSRYRISLQEVVGIDTLRGSKILAAFQSVVSMSETAFSGALTGGVLMQLGVRPVKFPFRGYSVFSHILTPLTGMNIPFDILKGKGPIIHNPIRTDADVAQVRELVPDKAVPHVGQALTALRSEVGNAAAVLGFVGAPFTLASCIVEGGSSKHFTIIKKMAFQTPEIFHSLLQKLTGEVRVRGLHCGYNLLDILQTEFFKV